MTTCFHTKIFQDKNVFFAVLQDFCKLAVDYLQKGPNVKVYNAAARKFQLMQLLNNVCAIVEIQEYTHFREVKCRVKRNQEFSGRFS